MIAMSSSIHTTGLSDKHETEQRKMQKHDSRRRRADMALDDDGDGDDDSDDTTDNSHPGEAFQRIVAHARDIQEQDRRAHEDAMDKAEEDGELPAPPSIKELQKNERILRAKKKAREKQQQRPRWS